MQKRIIFFVVAGMLVMQVSLGLISHFIADDIIRTSMQGRLHLTDIIGKNIDYILQSNLTRLQDISLTGSVDFEDGEWEKEKDALKIAYEYSIFTDGVFLLDVLGNVVMRYPHKSGAGINLLGIPYVSKTMSGRRPVISDVYRVSPTGRQVIFALVPLKNRDGEIIGVAGGEINPANYMFTRIIKATPAGEDTCIELIDSHGTIISSNDPKRILTSADHNEYLGNLIARKEFTVGRCHRCHSEGAREDGRTEDILAFAPLSVAPWGIAVREPQSIVFSNSRKLNKILGVLGVFFIITAAGLAVGLSRSIVRPIQSLMGAARRIGRGELEEPVRVSSKDEVGTLALSFEKMRVRLKESLDRLREHSDELEKRVAQRTKELMKRRKQLSTLFHKAIGAQEEERKRIARDLHDETSQTIAALGMSLEIAHIALRENRLTPEMIHEQMDKVEQLLDGIGRLIQDLRPPVLDDLGLEAAVRWMLDSHLVERGIKYTLMSSEEFERGGGGNGVFMDETNQLAVFRIIQEAVINICKHSSASNVYVSLSSTDSRVLVEIEDDGVGFDVETVFKGSHAGMDGGYGLLGMRERVELLDGALDVTSGHLRSGGGTHIMISIPLKSLR